MPDKKLRQLNTLVDMAALVSSSLQTSEIRTRAIEAATRLVSAETGSLLLLDQGTGELYFEVALGEEGEKLKTIRLKRGEGIAGWVALHGEALLVPDVQQDPRFFEGADRKSEFQTRDMLCVPVKTKDRTLGVLQAINSGEDGGFDDGDLEMLGALASQVAVAVENAGLFEKLKKTFYHTAQALAETIEKRDPYTGGHTRRVMEYSVAIALRMGLDKQGVEDLRLAAILHDIGKIGVRDNVLLKQEQLDDDELKKMNQHPGFGAEILDHVPELSEIIPGVKAHHEKYDGTGYPEGLSGTDIPLAARIIAVADTFDAMTTDRPYRKGLTPEAAIQELRKNIGIQFDGKAVEAFLRAWDAGVIGL